MIPVADLALLSLNLVIAFSHSIRVDMAAFAAEGLAIGLQAIGTGLLFTLWGRQASLFLQLLYFMLGIGTMAAPLLVLWLIRVLQPTAQESVATTGSRDQAIVTWVFSIIACFHAVSFAFGCLVYCLWPQTSDHPSRSLPLIQESDSGKPVERTSKRTSTAAKVVVKTLHLMSQHIYMGSEVALGSFLTLFAMRSPVSLSQETGTQLTTVYWFAFTFAKLPAAFLLIPCIGNLATVSLGLVIALAGSVAFIMYGSFDAQLLLISVVVVAVGTSPVNGCMMGFLEDFIPVTPGLSALSSAVIVMGEFTFPALVSLFIEDHPVFLCHVVLAIVFSLSILFPIIVALSYGCLANARG